MALIAAGRGSLLASGLDSVSPAYSLHSTSSSNWSASCPSLVSSIPGRSRIGKVGRTVALTCSDGGVAVRVFFFGCEMRALCRSLGRGSQLLESTVVDSVVINQD